MKEAPLRRKIQKYLKQRGAYSYHPHGAMSALAGAPDLFVCYRGRFLGLEVKLPEKEATELQARTLGEIKLAGGVGRVVYSVEDAEAILRRVDDRIDVGKRRPASSIRRRTSQSGQ